MVRGRGRAALAGAAVACACAGLLLAGCGATTRPNDPRPSVSTRLSVIIGPHAVIVQPGEVGVGEEPTQQIPQNRGARQPDIETGEPLDVTFVAANQTGEASRLVVHGKKDVSSEKVLARSPATFSASLPAGSYTVMAPDVKGARPAHFTVGTYRASSQNDVLLP